MAAGGATGRRRITIAPIVLYESEARVKADFERRYESAASRTLNTMTAYDAWPTLR